MFKHCLAPLVSECALSRPARGGKRASRFLWSHDLAILRRSCALRKCARSLTPRAPQEALFLDPGAPGVELDYVIVRPGGLTTGPPSGQFKVRDWPRGR